MLRLVAGSSPAASGQPGHRNSSRVLALGVAVKAYVADMRSIGWRPCKQRRPQLFRLTFFRLLCITAKNPVFACCR